MCRIACILNVLSSHSHSFGYCLSFFLTNIFTSRWMEWQVFFYLFCTTADCPAWVKHSTHTHTHKLKNLISLDHNWLNNPIQVALPMHNITNNTNTHEHSCLAYQPEIRRWYEQLQKLTHSTTTIINNYTQHFLYENNTNNARAHAKTESIVRERVCPSIVATRTCAAKNSMIAHRIS